MPPPRHIYASTVSRRQRRRWRRQRSPLWMLGAVAIAGTASFGAAATLGLLQVLGV
jgi:cytochrome c oxidase assembly factor CtaG